MSDTWKEPQGKWEVGHDECPNFGQHRMYVSKTYEDYQPYMHTLSIDSDATIKEQAAHRAVQQFIDSLPVLYERVEWAVTYCQCGLVKRQEVKQEN